MNYTIFGTQETRSAWRKLWAGFLMLSINLSLSGVGLIFATANIAEAATVITDSFGTGNSVDDIPSWNEEGDDDDDTTLAQKFSSSGYDSASPDGGRFAKISHGEWICRTMNGNSSVNFSLSYYWRGDTDAENNEHGDIEVRDGDSCTAVAGWVNVASHELDDNNNNTDEGWSSLQTVSLPSSETEQPKFSLRFRNEANDSGEYFRIDGVSVSSSPIDTDSDTIPDTSDNCPTTPNTLQTNTDGDSEGDACDTDDDNDTVLDTTDNCVLIANTLQEDNDADAQGDACDTDDDNDTVIDSGDNCPMDANTNQADADDDGLGDVCDTPDPIDTDSDGIVDEIDNCPLVPNADQLDENENHVGDACEVVVPPTCESDTIPLTLVSDGTNHVGTADGPVATVLTFIHSAWTAAISGASWIWSTEPLADPVNDTTETFYYTFDITHPITGDVSLLIAADNSYDAWVNGTPIGSSADENNFQASTQDSYTVAGTILHTGTNELKITVKNLAQAEGTPTSNPAGLLYKLDYSTNSCELPPADVCPNIDGNQPNIPEGQEKNDAGDCVDIPVDVCENLDGMQTTVPSGSHLEDGDQCVTDPIDVCDNITGVQTSVPEGMELDDENDCVEIPEEAPTCNPEVNLIENSGFEAPAVSSFSIVAFGDSILKWFGDWVNPHDDSVPYGLEIQNHAAGTPAEGNQLAELDGYHPVKIYQDITTIPGKDYRLTFKYSPRPGTVLGNNVLEVRKDGTLLGEQISRGSTSSDTEWSTETRTFTATDSITKIEFADVSEMDDQLGTYLDDVSLYCVLPVVPTEPVLTVIKHVINDNGGTKTASDFDLKVEIKKTIIEDLVSFLSPNEALAMIEKIWAGDTFPGDEEGTDVYFEGASGYKVTEEADAGYTTTYSEGCEGEIEEGGTATCTVTNDDIAVQIADYCPNLAGVQDSVPPGYRLVDGQCYPNGGVTLPSYLGGGAPLGLVLGAATTDEEISAVCGEPYLNDYLRMGHKNNPEEVKKLQTFLNKELGLTLPITGFFGKATLNAVKQFQLQNSDQILAPWLPFGLKIGQPTGYVYKTTKRWINLMECKNLDIPMPDLSQD